MIPMWLGMMDEGSKRARMAEIEADLEDTYFGWHGVTDGSGPIYYRIQGPASSLSIPRRAASVRIPDTTTQFTGTH